MKNRLIYIAILLCIGFTYVFTRLSMISTSEEYSKISIAQSTANIKTDSVFANIYDRNFNKLVNNETVTIIKEVNGKEINFDTIKRYSENQLASHIIGYVNDGTGVCGIELECNDFLRSYCEMPTVEVKGNEVTAFANNEIYAGVVTTLDKRIQEIAEITIDKYINSGAVVIMDINNGDIVASVSRPNYSPLDLYEAVKDTENTPLINRVNQSYNLGSIFKLVIAATAIDKGISVFTKYDCDGYVDILGQSINCHNKTGHKTVNMIEAMNDSCNSYFIQLGSNISSSHLNFIASKLSFGRIIKYASNLNTKSGYLQSVKDLENSIEKANFSFGQGKLTATPLQVCMMTCAFANSGKMPEAKLIIGNSLDGFTVESKKENIYTYAINEETSNIVKELMISVVEYEGNKLAKPNFVTAGGKTATAQTGQYNEDKSEKLNCWFTGFFPAKKPKYAVTILAENAKSALSQCGACFADICDEIYINLMT